MSDELTILAKCSRCGRGFVALPAKLPAFDVYGRADGYRVGDPACGGRIELTAEGTKSLSTGRLHQDDKVTPPQGWTEGKVGSAPQGPTDTGSVT